VRQVCVKTAAIEYAEQPISSSGNQLIGALPDLLDGLSQSLYGVLDFQICRNLDLIVHEFVAPIVLEVRFRHVLLFSNCLRSARTYGVNPTSPSQNFRRNISSTNADADPSQKGDKATSWLE
jgi:hypothetical protein